jgi:paraquat-inducible protein B
MPAIRSALVGGFLLGGLALAVGAILLVGGTQLFAPVVRAVTFFSGSVAGLSVGAPITFRGVRVGSVESIALEITPRTLDARIPVVLQIEPGKIIWEQEPGVTGPPLLKRAIDAGLRAQLSLQSVVTGQLQVDLDFLPGTKPVTSGTNQRLPEIPAVPSALQQLKEQLSGLPLRDLAQTAIRALQSAEQLEGTLNDVIRPLADSVRTTSDTGRVTLETATRAIIDLQHETDTTLQDFDKLLTTSQSQLIQRSAELSQVLISIDRASKVAERLLVSVDSMTDARSPMRANLNATLRDLAASAASLRGFASDVERNPNLILTGRSGR